MPKPLHVNKMLSDNDIEILGRFLEKHELISLLELHGFLSAVVSGPNMIMPSEWLDYLELNTGAFETMDEAQAIMGTVMSLYNDICRQFQEQ